MARGRLPRKIAAGLALAIPLLAATGFSQLMTAPGTQLVELRVRVFDAATKQPLSGQRVLVRLMDKFGTVEHEKPADSEANVDFSTRTGLHRILIRGEGIENYEGEFQIDALETSHIENLYVKPRAKAGTDAGVIVHGASATVDVTRLKIPEKAERHFQTASGLMQAHDWSGARREFEAAIEIYPDYDLAHNGLGVVAFQSGDVVGARRAFEKAIAINQHFAGAYRNLARIFLSENDWSRADELLSKSLQNEPGNVWALTNAAYAELQTQHLSEAIANARRVHLLPHHGYENAHYIAAAALEANQQPAEALLEYQLYLQEAPKGPKASAARLAVRRLAANANTGKPPAVTPN